MPERYTAARRRRWLSAAAAAGLAGAGCFIGAPSAAAAGDYLQFSTDGRTYSSGMSGPVFQESIVHIPGSSAQADLWVRNNSEEPAVLTSAAWIVRSDPEMTGHVGLQGGQGRDLSERLSFGDEGTCTDIRQTWELAPAQDVKLSFVVDMALEAPNETRNREAQFDLVFLLEPRVTGVSSRSACAAVGVLPSVPGSPGVPAPPVSMGQRPQGETAVLAGTSRMPDTVPAFRDVPAAAEAALPGTVAKSQGTVSGFKAVSPLASAFASTVEPVIRSLSGTLLIMLAVAFAAALVIRLRESRYE